MLFLYCVWWGFSGTLSLTQSGWALLSWFENKYSNLRHFYRPQTKFGTRLCFYTCLSVILFMGGVSQYEMGGINPLRQTPPPPIRRPLQRTVRILLECILVLLRIFNCATVLGCWPGGTWLCCSWSGGIRANRPLGPRTIRERDALMLVYYH